MNSNIFYNLPTCGSDELTESNVNEKQTDESCREEEKEQMFDDVKKPKRKKNVFKKIIKFFTMVVSPILIFIPSFINACANLKRACAIAN